ncbi:MAG: GNAT family N-acetyltransferase [bacterium]
MIKLNKINWYKIAQINLSKEYPYGSFKRIDIIKNNKVIGHVSFKFKDNILYIDMINISDVEERRKGYASKAIKHLMNKYNTENVQATDNEYTNEGKDFFNNIKE